MTDRIAAMVRGGRTGVRQTVTATCQANRNPLLLSVFIPSAAGRTEVDCKRKRPTLWHTLKYLFVKYTISMDRGGITTGRWHANITSIFLGVQSSRQSLIWRVCSTSMAMVTSSRMGDVSVFELLFFPWSAFKLARRFLFGRLYW